MTIESSVLSVFKQIDSVIYLFVDASSLPWRVRLYLVCQQKQTLGSWWGALELEAAEANILNQDEG